MRIEDRIMAAYPGSTVTRVGSKIKMIKGNMKIAMPLPDWRKILNFVDEIKNPGR